MMYLGLPWEAWFIFVLMPILFMVWWYRRVLTAQPVKVAYEDQAGNFFIYDGVWNAKENKVVFKRSRKEKLTVTKKHNPKMINFSTIKREWWFKTKEGSGQTDDWGSDVPKDMDANVAAGYESIALLASLIEQIKSASVMSIKNQLFGLMAGAGLGLGAGILIAMLFGVA